MQILYYLRHMNNGTGCSNCAYATIYYWLIIFFVEFLIYCIDLHDVQCDFYIEILGAAL